MNLFNFYKIFRCGQKSGQRSKNPTAGITAHTEGAAWESFREHKKYKSKIEYICVDEGLAGAEELPNAGQRKPGEWSTGDTCWTKINPFDDEDTTYHEAVILEISDGPVEPSEFERDLDPDVKNGPIYTLWLTGDYGSWRARRASHLLTMPPKGKRKRRRKRPGKVRSVKPNKSMRRKK